MAVKRDRITILKHCQGRKRQIDKLVVELNKILLSTSLCVIGFLQVSFCIGQNNLPQRNSMTSSDRDSNVLKERVMLKNYAFCRCLIQQAPNDSLFRHDGSLSGYLEIGWYNENAYTEIDSFISK